MAGSGADTFQSNGVTPRSHPRSFHPQFVSLSFCLSLNKSLQLVGFDLLAETII